MSKADEEFLEQAADYKRQSDAADEIGKRTLFTPWEASDPTTTADQVAQWMVATFRHKGVLYHRYAAFYIGDNFGSSFVTTDANGRNSIDEKVKKAFKKLHGGKAKWDRQQNSWKS